MPEPPEFAPPEDPVPPGRPLEAWKALAIHWVQEAQNTPELAAALRALEHGLSQAEAGSISSALFPGQEIGSRDLAWSLLSDADILYAFLGAVPGQGLITAAWTRRVPFQIDAVYVRTSKGVYRTRFRTLAEFRSRLERRRFTQVHRSMVVDSELPVEEPAVYLNFPKIPRNTLERVYGFFDYVYRTWDGEAVAFLYYSPERGFHIGIPPQKLFRYRTYRGWRTEDRVEYGSLPRPDGYLKLGDAHSHGDTPAFFSGTDDRDDQEDGLRIVMGDLDRACPSVRVSFLAGRNRFRLDRDQVLEDFLVPLPPPVEWTRQVVCRYEGVGARDTRIVTRPPQPGGGWNGQTRRT